MPEGAGAGGGRRAADADPRGAISPEAAEELFELLLVALKELGDAGQPERANRLAASAYARLRKQQPERAQRINVLMHRRALRT